MAAGWVGHARSRRGRQAKQEGGTDRLMSQDEIDTMLGFTAGDDKDDRNGIQAIVDSGSVAYERLPMLEIIFERLVRPALDQPAQLLHGQRRGVTLESIRSVRFGDYINSISQPALLSVFKAEEWDNFGLVTIESALIYSVLDTLLRRQARPACPRALTGAPSPRSRFDDLLSASSRSC